MMCKTKGNKLGLVLGLLLGLCHLGWVVLVAVGVAQSLLNWILRLHSINPSLGVVFDVNAERTLVEVPNTEKYVLAVTGFDWTNAILLVVMTFVVGYVLGWVVSLLCKLVCWCCCKGASQSGQSGCCSKD